MLHAAKANCPSIIPGLKGGLRMPLPASQPAVLIILVLTKAAASRWVRRFRAIYREAEIVAQLYYAEAFIKRESATKRSYLKTDYQLRHIEIQVIGDQHGISPLMRHLSKTKQPRRN
jgi:acetyl/propionyl-CoA carboxylase alpha subunit